MKMRAAFLASVIASMLSIGASPTVARADEDPSECTIKCDKCSCNLNTGKCDCTGCTVSGCKVADE